MSRRVLGLSLCRSRGSTRNCYSLTISPRNTCMKIQCPRGQPRKKYSRMNFRGIHTLRGKTRPKSDRSMSSTPSIRVVWGNPKNLSPPPRTYTNPTDQSLARPDYEKWKNLWIAVTLLRLATQKEGQIFSSAMIPANRTPQENGRIVKIAEKKLSMFQGCMAQAQGMKVP